MKVFTKNILMKFFPFNNSKFSIQLTLAFPVVDFGFPVPAFLVPFDPLVPVPVLVGFDLETPFGSFVVGAFASFGSFVVGAQVTAAIKTTKTKSVKVLISIELF
jgi:hypothetical protein